MSCRYGLSAQCLFNHTVTFHSISSKAFMCTAPTASPCAVAEGISFFDMPISKLPFITNHPAFRILWREGAWRNGYIYLVAPDRALNFIHLSHLSRCTNTIEFRGTYVYLFDFQTTNLRSNPPLTSHSSFPPSTLISPHYEDF